MRRTGSALVVGATAAIAAAWGCASTPTGVHSGPGGANTTTTTVSSGSGTTTSTTTTSAVCGAGADLDAGAPGSVVWAEGFAAGGASIPTGIAVDPQGNTTLVGYYTGTLALGPADGGTVTSGGGNYSYFVASFDPTGAYRWSASLDAI